MADDKEAFRKKLLVAFQEEAGERMRVLADALAVMEQAPAQELVESVFREIHSLKGAARAVSARAIEQLCQSWESLFAAIRKGQLPLQRDHLALSRRTHSTLLQLLGDTDGEATPTAGKLQQALERAAAGEESALPAVEVAEPMSSESEWSGLSPPSDSLRVSASILDSILFQTEELQVVKLQARQNSRNLKEAVSEFQSWRKMRHEVAVAARQLRHRQDEMEPRLRKNQQTLLEYLDWTRDHLGQWESRLGSLARSAEQLNREIAAAAESLRQDLQALLLLPCSRLIEGVPAMLQDISAEMGKLVTLQVCGESLQVDKRILDELKSPLQHLLRNAVDHGIESSLRRQALGKPEKGCIAIEFRQESAACFELIVTDDGVGMDPAELKARAVAQKLIEETDVKSMSDADAYRLALLSGLSTRNMITELSGRGLGLAIVQEKVERLGGHLEISSQAGAGSRLLIRLPTSLSTYRALLVQVTEHVMAIPSLAVERVFRLPWNQIRSVENRLTVSVADTLLPLSLLAEILGLKKDQLRVSGLAQLVLLNVSDQRFCLLVDEILGDWEMVVKSLGPQLQRVRNVLGVSQLGDGRIVPILHPQDLYKNACRVQSHSPLLDQSQAQAPKAKILVAEDSITSRSLLRQILESAGYEVTTVCDGMEAWETLRNREFDLLVSDIEMPRMDGFTLTEKIRASRTMNELPVILVTALKSPEDRERGLEAGANAYIVKSGFDQTGLLGVVRQLL